MKKTAIVTGGTKNQFPAMAVLALNIADKCPNIADELVIFHDGVPIEEQHKVQKIFPTRFIEYTSPFNNTESCFSDNVTKYFSLMVFCKYECFRLLEEYATVIWTDYDVLIEKDISELVQMKNACSKFITDEYLVRKFDMSLFYKHTDLLKTDDVLGTAISTGLFALFDIFPKYKQFYDDCIAITEELGDSLSLPEEAVISILLKKYNIVYDDIDTKIYVRQPKDLLQDKTEYKILHAAGQPKFWNGLYNEKWNKYYSEWVNNYKGMEFVQNEQKKNIIKKIIKCILPYGIVRLIQKNRKK